MLAEPAEVADIIETSTEMPECTICGAYITIEDIFLIIKPAHLEISKKSNRYKTVEDEFDFLDDVPVLFWHYECATEALLDTSLIGHPGQRIDRGSDGHFF